MDTDDSLRAQVRAAIDPEGDLPSQSLKGIRVVLVEHHRDSRDALATLLGLDGAIVISARTAAEGFRAIETGRPDVLLVDLVMPGEDGCSLIRRIRALPPARGGTVPAVALTAMTLGEDRGRILAAGFQYHLPKPCEPDRLIAMVRTLASKS
jgi:CheY-like chemotaxis protein